MIDQPEEEPPETILQRLRPWWIIIVIAFLLLSLVLFRVAATLHLSKTKDSLVQAGYSVSLQPEAKPALALQNAAVALEKAFAKFKRTGNPSDPFANYIVWPDDIEDPFASGYAMGSVGLIGWRNTLTGSTPRMKSECIEIARKVLGDNALALTDLHLAEKMPYSHWPTFEWEHFENHNEAIRLLGHELILASIDNPKRAPALSSIKQILRYDRTLRQYGFHSDESLILIELLLMHMKPDRDSLIEIDRGLETLEQEFQALGAAAARNEVYDFLEWFETDPAQIFQYTASSNGLSFWTAYFFSSNTGLSSADIAVSLKFAKKEIHAWEASLPNWEERHEALMQQVDRRESKPFFFMATRGLAIYYDPYEIIHDAVRVRALRCALAILLNKPPLPNNWDGAPPTLGKHKQWSTVTLPTSHSHITIFFLNPTDTQLSE